MADDRHIVVCAECEGEIELCEFCEQPDCSTPSCYGCLLTALRREAPEPYSAHHATPS